MRYFITFACYGHHLHGDESGSVDREHNLPGSRLVEADPKRANEERQAMTEAPYVLNEIGRITVMNAIQEVCAHRHWNLLAAHVRTDHVHAVVEADVQPEPIMNAFKSYASRHLNRLQGERPDRKRWARHGSTRWLWKDQDVRDAVRYVADEQGERMALYVADDL